MPPSEKIIEAGIEAVKNFKSSKNFILFFILGIALTMPLWFVAIFYFAPKFYLNTPVWVVVIFSFCFSLMWVILNIIDFALLVENKKTKRTKEDRINTVYWLGGFKSIIFIGMMLFFCYLKIIYITNSSLKFHHVLLYTFLPMGILVSIRAVVSVTRGEKGNSKINESDNRPPEQ